MSEQQSEFIVGSFLSGVCDVLDAMLSLVLRKEVDPAETCGADSLAVGLSAYPVYAFAGAGENGGLALLMDTEAALRMAAMLQGEEPGEHDTLNDSDREQLLEVVGGAVMRGMMRVMADCGADAPPPAEPRFSDRGADDAAALMKLLQPPIKAATAILRADPDFELSVMVVFTERLERLAPGKAEGPDLPGATGVLTPDEMNDILRGFDMDQQPLGVKSEPEPAVIPGNLDMVLDIKLRATARLGSIEMALADVLSFGPGTIVDVGRLVDEPVDLLVNNKLIARGDVVVVDEKYGLRITEIVSPRERIESLR